MQFRLWRAQRAKNRRRFSRSNQSLRQFQRRILALEHLESRAMLTTGILLLDHTGMGLYSRDTGGIQVHNGDLVIDSHNSNAGVDVGAGSITATNIHSSGGIHALGSGKFVGSLSHVAATADPLASLPVPTITTPVHAVVHATGNQTITLSPGTYNGGIHVADNATVNLQPGIYYLQGGGLSVLDNGTLTGTDVMIYNGAKTRAGKTLIGVNATVNLSAPSEGTYAGVVFFQNSVAPFIVNGGNIHLVGTVYAPKALLYFASNTSLHVGGSAEDGFNGELIFKDLQRSGAGTIFVDATNNILADLAITISDDSGSDGEDGDETDDQEVSTEQAEAGTAIPGESITYTITVTNNGPLAVTGAAVKDTFPSAISSDTYTAVGSSGATGFTMSGSGNIADTVNLTVGASITYTVVAQIASSATGSLADTATVTPPASPADPNLANNTATDTVTLTPEADLAVTKTDGTTTAVPGNSATYTITVTNNGPSDVTGATVSDTMPSSFTSFMVSGSNGFSTSGGSGGSFTDSSVNLVSGASVTYTVTGTIDPAATGSLSNTATASTPDGTTETDTGDNSATDTDTLTPQVDLAVTKTDNVTTAVPGTSDTYTITVINNGPSTITSLTLTDTVPAALGSVNFTPSVGSYDSGTGVWSGLNLASGQSITMQLSGTIDAGATGSLTNTVTVAAPAGATDTNSGNNTATDTDTLSPQVDLAVTKSDNKDSAVPGTEDTYTITVTNNGPSTVTSLTLTDTVPAELTNISFTPSVGSYDPGTGVWSGLNLASGQSITMQLSGTIDAAATGTISNTVTVSAPVGVTDTNAGNNSATDTDNLTPQADLAVTKSDGTDFVFRGSSNTYTITVTNNGPSTVTSLNLDDALPADLDGVSFTPSDGSYDSGSGVWSGLNLASGQMVTMQVSGTINVEASDMMTNVVTVTAPSGVTDTNLSNNTATDVDEVDSPIQ